MKTKKPFAVIFCSCALLFLSSLSFCLEQFTDTEFHSKYCLSPNIGLNLLQKGFPGYTNNYCVGADFYMSSEALGESWWSAWRLSSDYFPLVVPEGVYGTTEDMFDISFSKVYIFPLTESQRSQLFTGIGIGLYGDWIRLDTPATGAMSNISYYPGLSASFGIRIKLKGSMELVPEIRSHFVYTANNYFTVNTSIGLGVLWRFDQE
jgi:hypothetical protein